MQTSTKTQQYPPYQIVTTDCLVMKIWSSCTFGQENSHEILGVILKAQTSAKAQQYPTWRTNLTS